MNIAGSTVGLAYVGTMCTRSVAIGLTQDGGGALNSVGAIAAHELGHIFNMNHDNSSKYIYLYLKCSVMHRCIY